MPRLFQILFPESIEKERTAIIADIIVLLFIAALIYLGITLAFNAPSQIKGPHINLSVKALPWYALLSVGRMTAAYILSFIFSLIYGYAAIKSKYAEMILMPLLDVLQSVPILSFLPVVLLSLSAVLPEKIAVELASIILIFTSQVWNLTFAWYQSLSTIPKDLKEASSIFHIRGWLRLKTLDLPFAAVSLIWNSMMSWAGGWFFLMAAEIFTVGNKDFRLPGLGAYLQEAANKGDLQAVFWGVLMLIFVIVALDQFVWRPLLAWSSKFKLEMTESEVTVTSWFYDLLIDSRIIMRFRKWLLKLSDSFDMLLLKFSSSPQKISEHKTNKLSGIIGWLLLIGIGCFISIYLYKSAFLLKELTPHEWWKILVAVFATFLRVSAALVIALLWTIPVGVAIGTNQKVARWLQPIVQIAASVPATALFPAFLLFVLKLPGKLNTAAILLMLMGTQWYLLFNIIAGASAIPQDLKYTAKLLQLNTWQKWRHLILPALFPYIVTGIITAGGGAWNASIVAEYIEFAGKTLKTTGIGAMITQSTAQGNYPMLLAATLAMILAVVAINRAVWRPLYRLAEEKYHMD